MCGGVCEDEKGRANKGNRKNIYIDISLSSFKRDRERWREGSKGGDLGIWVGGDTCNFSGSSIQRALTSPCRWWGADVSGFDCEVDL